MLPIVTVDCEPSPVEEEGSVSIVEILSGVGSWDESMSDVEVASLVVGSLVVSDTLVVALVIPSLVVMSSSAVVDIVGSVGVEA